MREQWQHQVRLYLDDALAEAARRDPADPGLAAVLNRHDAAIVSQLDAFEAYVAEAEREGAETDALYRWTKATLADPEKRRRHARAFAVRVAGRETYAQAEADALEAGLAPMVGGLI